MIHYLFARQAVLSALSRLTVGRLRLVETQTDSVHEFGTVSPGHPCAVLQIHETRAYWLLLTQSEIGLAYALRDGLLESPHLEQVLLVLARNREALTGSFYGLVPWRLLNNLRHWARRNNKQNAKDNIQAHYDLGNDFYRLWLDSSMTYSSALFEGDFEQTLEQAQRNKIQALLAPLGNLHQKRILEIGFGWGAVAREVSRQGALYQGLTLSKEQLTYATELLQAQALTAEFRLQDYRDYLGKVDAVVSVEMLEAVGEQYWDTYFEKISQVLTPGGQAAIQTIVIAPEHFEQYRQSSDFIQQFIFPGGMLPTIPVLQGLIEKHGFELKALRAFGPDYAETLRRWRYRFEGELPAVRQLGFDEKFIKIWRMYFQYCEAGFDSGSTDVVQLHFFKKY